ncbi:MAG: PEP-CTERM sorting domain-containing protein [Armatimonadetes bacterium]|nr:PEP-CTERM sorting domain-containing protein [Armatimonadota bacterium]MBS1727475.1 PEP-CTERM sorting domain-containing protein [Armatimonadota bacterium]
MKKYFALFILTGIATAANAQQILTRGDLNSILSTSTTDDFETFNVADQDATTLFGNSVLDSTTTYDSQGPNLVHSGAFYVDSSEYDFQWNGDHYFGLNSKTLVANGTSGGVEIVYNTPVGAMGVDAMAYSGYGYAGTMKVYSGVNLLGTVNFSLSGTAGETVFLGWQSTQLITSVSISSPAYSWSPIIDNHTYGSVGTVPEPASMAVLGLGALALVRRRRTQK